MDARERMLQLFTLLQSGRTRAAADLAARLGTTERTLRRDVDFLREQGYPVQSVRGPGGHYRLSSGTALPPLMLDDDEAVAVALGLRLAAAGALGVSLEQDAAERSLQKLRRMLPARLRSRTDALLSAVDADRRERPLPASGTFRLLAAAITAHEVVRFDHAKGTTRTVEPYRLVSISDRWYLFTWDHDRQDWRTFRLDRITSAEPTGATFAPRTLPTDDLPAYIARHFREPALRTIVLDLAVGAGDAATRLHRVDGSIEPLTTTSCRYTAVVDSYEWLAMVLAVSEVDFTVVSPVDFAVHLRKVGDRFTRGTKHA